MIVTIDGPAGAGKSAVSRRLAAALGFAFLDTGALYRALALAALNAGRAGDDEAALAGWLPGVDITVRLEGGRFLVLLDGRDVEPLIRDESVAGAASRLSALAPVRARLLGLQRAAGEQGDLVAEGRDMGSVVFPAAQAKFFLTASAEERARRRLAQLAGSRPDLTLAAVLADLAERDERDARRSLSPLKPAADAVMVDTTPLSEDAVIARLARRVRALQAGQSSNESL
ncbi:MAG: (d)CMP kinase [Pseudomonadota bacterium]